MLSSKHRFLYKSFRFKVLLLIGLILVVCGLYFMMIYVIDGSDTIKPLNFFTEQNKRDPSTFRISYQELRSKTDRDIDSILFSFGIKKDWITTTFPDDKVQKQKKEAKNVVWFVKNILIPKDVNSAQVNLDITTYIKYLGLRDSVIEDIKTTDLVMYITTAEDTSITGGGMPLAKIFIDHSEKIARESSTFVIILNIPKYRHDSNTDYLLTNSNEFSYLFPRNPDDIELQNKLIQLKKDVILNLVLGREDNIDADFNNEMDEKEIRQKVRSIILDFPNIRTFILSKPDSSLKPGSIYSSIYSEFQKYSGTIIPDSSISRLLSKSEEDGKNKVEMIINRLRSRIGISSSIISVLTIPDDDLKDFYDQVIGLKKLGCKFYTYSQCVERQKQIQKRLVDKTDKDLSKITAEKNKSTQKKNDKVTLPKKNKK